MKTKEMTLLMEKPITKGRYYFYRISKTQDYDIWARHKKELYFIGTIRDRKFKRISCTQWPNTRGPMESLNIIQSYAALHAAKLNLHGP